MMMTENFNMSRHVGKGAFGDVFKGDTCLLMLSGPGASHEGGSKQSKLWKSLPAQVAVKRDIRKRTWLATTAAGKKESALSKPRRCGLCVGHARSRLSAVSVPLAYGERSPAHRPRAAIVLLLLCSMTPIPPNLC